jgi:sugar lactone lactonase YvrE
VRALLVVLTLATLAAGCSRRLRDNPLDPGNPETGGRPAGFNAVAGYASVTLTWTPQPALAIDGFQLERLDPGDSLYRPLGDVLPRGASTFLDVGRTNGLTYRYRIYYVIGGAPVRAPAEDLATPGPLRPWVTEYGGQRVARLSPDGRDVLFRVGNLGAVGGLALDPTGRLWCSAEAQGWLSGLETSGDFRLRIEGIQAPGELAVSPADETVWVVDREGQLLHYGVDGSPATPGSIGLLASPEGLAVGPGDLSVWVCEGRGNRVRRYSAAGSIIASAVVPQPLRVAVDSTTNIGWVTSYDQGRVYRIAGDGTVIDSAAVGGPVGIAVDHAHGRVWVADELDGVAIALDLTTLARLVTVPSLVGVRDVAIDRASGDAWFTVTGLDALVRLDVNGHELARLAGLDTPLDVRLDPGN